MNFTTVPAQIKTAIEILGNTIESRISIELAVQRWGPELVEAILPAILTKIQITQYSAYNARQQTSGDKMLLSTRARAAMHGAPLNLPDDVAPSTADYAAFLISRRYAATTLQSRVSCFRTIVAAANSLCVCPFPMSVGGALSIFAQFSYEGRQYRSICNLRDTVAMMHYSGVYPDPTKNWQFKQMMEGIKREIGTHSPNRKIALYRNEVGDIIEFAQSVGDVDVATMIAVVFEGALRAAEGLELEMRDVIERDGRVWLNIRRSKTDQGGTGALVELRRVPGASFDVLDMLAAWVADRGRAPGPLFPSLSKAYEKRKRRAFARRLKSYAAVVGRKHGFHASQVATHSLRAGYVTTEIDRIGKIDSGRVFSVAEIAAHLRHRSIDTLLIYYRPRANRPNFVGVAAQGKR